MSSLLYYSNYCENSKNLLRCLSNSSIKNEIHFLCIDKRMEQQGATYIELENGQRILLPPTITKVPALLLLNNNHQVLFGNDIINYFEPKQQMENNIATLNNGEPNAFAINSNNSCYGVASDNYSFLDQTDDEMSAKGNGGLRQQHHYSLLDNIDKIETPPDTYAPNTIGNISLEKLQNERNNNLNN